MKKTLLIVVAVIMASSVSAQEGTFYVGLSGISVPMGSEETECITGIAFDKSGSTSTTMFGIAPELGYFISNNWAVGLGVGFNYVNKDFGGGNSSNAILWGVKPYIRYYALKIEKFSLYLDGGLSYASSKIKDQKAVHIFTIGVIPAVSYNVSERFAINASIGGIGYSDYGNSRNRFALALDSGLEFGLTFSF
ncbi:MAG: porin family protein [Bacteroidales bacterium]|nr:porin family protein [Bacteroidales bacterium]MCL2132839.1 porin family protein [Bacteroidales bacterium]